MELTPVERALVEHVERGTLLNLATAQDPVIRADVVRDILRGRLAPDPDPRGLQLRAARISGKLDLEHLETPVVVDLHLCRFDDEVLVRDARVPSLVLVNCVLRNDSGTALNAQRLVTRRLDLRGTRVEGAGSDGAVNLISADLYLLNCGGAVLRNSSGPALQADGLRVEGDLLLRQGFAATGFGPDGVVRLRRAHVGNLTCTGAVLDNESGPGFVADGLRVAGSAFLRNGFRVRVSGAGGGAVELLGAHLGLLDLSNAELRNTDGPALAADGMRVDGEVSLSGAIAEGTGGSSAVRLLGTHVDHLTCTGTRMRNPAGRVLAANRMRVDQRLGLLDVDIVGDGPDVALDLTGVRVGGGLVFEPARLQHLGDPRRRIALDGLTYTGEAYGTDAAAWLALLRDGTPGYAAQPYQHLAAAYRAAGHDTEARQVLVAQRREQRRSGAITGRTERLWSRVTGLTLGYGYQPWRALVGLLGVITTAVVLTVVLGGSGALAATGGGACTAVEQVGVGLDLGTPLVSTGMRARCDTTDTAAGQWLTVAGWGLRVLAWAFATLFVAGFTAVVRKT